MILNAVFKKIFTFLVKEKFYKTMKFSICSILNFVKNLKLMKLFLLNAMLLEINYSYAFFKR